MWGLLPSYKERAHDTGQITSPLLLKGRFTIITRKSHHGLYDENSAFFSGSQKSLPISVSLALRPSWLVLSPQHQLMPPLGTLCLLTFPWLGLLLIMKANAQVSSYPLSHPTSSHTCHSVPYPRSYHVRPETPLFTCFFAVCSSQLKRQLHEGRCPISFTVFTPVPRTALST